MAEEVLVDKNLEDGEKVIKALRAKNFDVSAAFWMQIDDGFWHLYIASKDVDGKAGIVNARNLVYSALGELGISSIESSDVALISTGKPVAKEVLELQSKYPLGLYSRQRLRKLGGLRTAEAHIYPLTQ